MRRGVVILLLTLSLLVIIAAGGAVFFGQSLVRPGEAVSGPTATIPPFARYHADDVWQRLQAAGLPVQDWRANPVVGASLVPHTWTEAQQFTIGDGQAGGGQVFTFATATDLAAVQQWFAATPALSPYVYVRGNALLWVSGYVPAADATRYQAALNTLP